MIKNSIPYFLFLSLMVFLSSCKENATSTDSSSESTSVMQPGASEPTEVIPPVTLNNGAKWDADDLTPLNVGDMKKAINAFDESVVSGDEYDALIHGFELAYKATINSSTMTGDARTQLINYMRQMEGMMTNLRSNDRMERQKAILQIKNHLNTYSDFFN